ncbi:hypothetical protein [Planomonospora venezuelensis]|uniref:Uncharacterized protein n=1 Tax=Planomonospora venezuelensis TaxID=1999 RepID=A0A841DAZ0_PLAVE|nr:hypothetical protein [Planomonospora venezuelensis]MBB5965285.1 hypothetical protein [Planomonospora venezuelensis]GIN00481.1 hypothetical protein Pve01_21390 [Planomonospora venezuelensis]
MVGNRVMALSDGEAVSALWLVLEQQGSPLDAARLRADEARVAEAAGREDIRAEIGPDEKATPGDAARAALLYLAESDPGTVARAAEIAATGRAERFDPALIGVGALVLIAVRTEFKLERDPEKGWAFKLHHRPMRDSTLGRLISKLIGLYPPP